MPQRDAVPDRIYKIASIESVAAADATGRFEGMPIDTQDGYIHFSTASQVTETLRLHFCGQSGLVLLGVSTAALGEDLRWEPSRGGALFPHLYAPLAMSAVVWRGRADVAADGTVTLPEDVR